MKAYGIRPGGGCTRCMHATGKLFMLLLCACLHAGAQPVQRESDEKVIADLLERLIESREEEMDYTDLQEQLEQYNRNKINLNTATRAQLQRLFFLDEKQVSALLEHRARFGDYLALYELQSIEALDELTVYYLTYFVAVDESWQEDRTSFTGMVKKGRHELIALYETDFQQRAGFDPQRKAQGKSHYMGDRSRRALRYRFAYGNRLTFGFTGEKDMGEPFGRGAQKYGFDFNSLHFCYRPRKGLVKTIALGDYQVSFGQGLTFGSGIAPRKSAFVLNVRRSFQPVRPYRSLNENEFLRGASLVLASKRWQAVLFGSAQYISTNHSGEDTLESNAAFSSISLTGLHRTATEAARKHNVLRQVYGAGLQWRLNNGHIGLTQVHAGYSAAFHAGDKPYRRYYFSGTAQAGTGIDYQLQWRNISFFGEFSRSSNGALAGLSGMIVSLDANFDVAVLYRNYAKDHQPVLSNSFGENADARNEHGVYTGASLKLSRRWTLNAYMDLYRSSWLRYLADGPSHGADVLGECQYTPSRTTQLYIRYRRETKLRNQAGNTTVSDYLSSQERSSYRFNASWKAGPGLSARSRLELVTFSDDLHAGRTGTLIFQDMSWSTPKKKFSLTVRLACFTVEDYNSRVYATEHDVLYQYSVPLYQNSGTRYYLVARYAINRRAELWMKLSETRYSNVQAIGSGLEQVQGNRISDIRLQVRVIL